LIGYGPEEQQAEFLTGLNDDATGALRYLFDFWALPHQAPPAGDWRTWVILGGRGAGKTRAGAEWVRWMAEGRTPLRAGRVKRLALVGETMEQAREVMVFGESGILAISPPDRRPSWIAGRNLLAWPNGAEAQVLSAHDPEGLRGRQFAALWADELAKWKRAEEAWDMLQFGLRLGDDPRACVTTTPRRVPLLEAMLQRNSTVTTHASTHANSANLAEGFLAEIEERYGGTRLGRQEIEGLLLNDIAGALWSWDGFQRVAVPLKLDRVVVAVDPPASSGGQADACGIVVAGVAMQGAVQDWRAVVLEDASVTAASPLEWARAAVAAFHRHGADRLVAEVNQGGEMVEAVLRQVDPLVPYRAVRAARGKAARAEPVAALYEQGRVSHLHGLAALEDQMVQMTAAGFAGRGSPDRVDALVWALHDLMIAPAAGWRNPRIRLL
jgi:phage terminase large subunit-like protein